MKGIEGTNVKGIEGKNVKGIEGKNMKDIQGCKELKSSNFLFQVRHPRFVEIS